MEKKIEVYENTEVQELIGYIPSSLQKWGIYLIALFILVLFTGSFFFQYPDMLNGKIIIPPSNDSTRNVSGFMYLQPANFGEITKGQKVLVFTEIYLESKYGFLTGAVSQIHGMPDASGNYLVEVRFPNGLKTNLGMELSSQIQLSGTGKIILEEKRLIEALIKPNK